MVVPARLEWNRDVLAAVLLCAAAGMADAVGYVHGGIFAANMTGNTVLAGLAVADGQWLKAVQRVATLGTFFAGAVLGRMLLNLAGNRSAAPLGVEAAFTFCAALTAPGSTAEILLITFAMGVQTTALTRFHGVALSTVVMTSTMARLAETAADRVMRGFGRRAPRHGMPSGLLMWTWVAYGGGAAIAGVLVRYVTVPLVLPALVVILVTALYARALSPRR
jgi:uncharacterized membrane protein YoaK (UPF0700 family)